MKKCQYCNKEFEPTNNRQKYCQGPHIRICPVCNNEYMEKDNWQLQFPPHACSYKCRGILQSKTKATKPKKLRKLQQILLDNPQYLLKLQEQNAINKKTLIPKVEHWLNYYEINYRKHHKINDIEYEFQLLDENALIALAEFSNDYTCNLKKVQIAEQNNSRCMIVYPWDNIQKIALKFASKIKANLRDCSLYKLNRNKGNEFLNQYHLQNACRNQLLYWGIVQDDEIVQLMTFGKSRYSKKHSIEVMRYCTKPDTEIPGGYVDLFYGLIALQYLPDVVGYEQIGRLNDVNYWALGFEYEKTTQPQEIWSKGEKYITAQLLRSHGYNQLFRTSYKDGASNYELMLNNDWLPLYDCGQKVFVFTKC